MFCIGSIEISLPFVHSKKERRAITNQIIDKMRKNNISVMDSSSEYPHEALIMFTFVKADEESIKRVIQKCEEILYEAVADDSFELNYELI